MDKNRKIVQKFDFYRFSRFILRRYMRWILVKFIFVVNLQHMNKHKEFHNYRLKPIGNNIRASWTKTGKSSKNFTFPDFQDFFYADIFSGFLWNFVSGFTYTIYGKVTGTRLRSCFSVRYRTTRLMLVSFDMTPCYQPFKGLKYLSKD